MNIHPLPTLCPQDPFVVLGQTLTLTIRHHDTFHVHIGGPVTTGRTTYAVTYRTPVNQQRRGWTPDPVTLTATHGPTPTSTTHQNHRRAIRRAIEAHIKHLDAQPVWSASLEALDAYDAYVNALTVSAMAAAKILQAPPAQRRGLAHALLPTREHRRTTDAAQLYPGTALPFALQMLRDNPHLTPLDIQPAIHACFPELLGACDHVLDTSGQATPEAAINGCGPCAVTLGAHPTSGP